MTRIIIISAFAIGLMSGTCKSAAGNSDPAKASSNSQSYNLDTTKLKPGETFYQCTMDPQVISDKSGECTVCGMDLIEMKKH